MIREGLGGLLKPFQKEHSIPLRNVSDVAYNRASGKVTITTSDGKPRVYALGLKAREVHDAIVAALP
jgi:hypothetical protein